MRTFEIHLKSGQTLTWHCEGDKQAKDVREHLEKIISTPEKGSLSNVVSLNHKNKEDKTVFLEKDVVAFSYKNNVKRCKVESVINGGNINGVHLGSGQAAVVGGMLEGIQKAAHLSRVKKEEEKD